MTKTISTLVAVLPRMMMATRILEEQEEVETFRTPESPPLVRGHVLEAFARGTQKYEGDGERTVFGGNEFG